MLLRAVNPWEKGHRKALSFIDNLAHRGYELLVSNILYEEKLKKRTRSSLSNLFNKYGFEIIEVDTGHYLYRATQWVIRNKVSPKRIFDIAHMMAAKDLHCKYIAAVDRFIRSRARLFNLVYINYYTGVLLR